MNNSTNSDHLHAISPFKKGMESEQDLGMYRKNGEEEREVAGSLRYMPSTVQEEQSSSFPYRYPWTTETNSNKSRWDRNYHNHPMGRHLLPVHDKSLAQKEESQKKEDEVYIYESGVLSISSSRPNISLDDHTGTLPQIPKVPNDDKCILEIDQTKDHQHYVRSITHGSRGMGQKKFDQDPKDERSISLSARSERENNSKVGRLGVRELLGDQSMDCSTTVEARTTNQIPNNISTDKRIYTTVQELPDVSEMIEQLKDDPRGYHENTDKGLLHPEDREYFRETFGITGVRPVFVDHSGMVVLMLDDRGIMFKWNEMEQSMKYMGRNLKEGLANHLYFPENICAIIESTGELIPVDEVEARVELQDLAEPIIVIDKKKKKSKKNK
ncbi:3466_t:CDS:2 [Diversispora eburnea]|uniref:3466_t:CDS:1 n=1 Tax=Diversispora eburnea TaxID=1213867 RepID=A0A9N9GQA0_9GLOM|nr:3466_t:CDS:2 [Diversispora eburnea]